MVCSSGLCGTTWKLFYLMVAKRRGLRTLHLLTTTRKHFFIEYRKNLQPAFLPRQPIRLDAVADAEFADRFGQIIAHGAVREVEFCGDVAGGLALAGEAQHLAFAIVQRVGFGPGFQRQLRVDRATTAVYGAQRLGEVLGGSVLQ